jgi:predicted DNA-binding transcriptional regulator AlpA
MPEKIGSVPGSSVEGKSPHATVTRTDGNDAADPLLTPEEVAARLNVTTDWVWDHSSRRSPFLPVIRIGNAKLRYRASKIEEFINERERLSNLRRKRG